MVAGDSTSECEGWGGLVTPGLPHWGPSSPPQAASGPVESGGLQWGSGWNAGTLILEIAEALSPQS